MNESEMGYRGSKSVLLSDTVKEQRVDGSYCNLAKSKLMQLRCTLTGFERNYQVKIPSKNIHNNQKFSIFTSPQKLLQISCLLS